MKSLVLTCVLLASCAAVEEGASPCHEARRMFHGCGTSLSLLDGDCCVGPRLLVAECVVDHGATCDELATLDVEACIQDRVGEDEDDLPQLPLDPSAALPRDEAASEPLAPATESSDERCADGLDNDSDGYVDCQDIDCTQAREVTVCGPGSNL